ncbi:MAG: phosphoribosylformylglycinamidine synthase subunit PurL [Candidatus Hecatellaceae archaeon]
MVSSEIPEGVSLTREEVEWVRKRLGREPNPVEWGMFDIMYSEHCSYKSSRPILKILPTQGPRVIVGPGYDCGIVDIGDGYAVAFKVESHNHPSAIEPYNGAATGIGGIVRDILCVGARPIALLDSLRFGDLKSPHSRWLFRYVVKGIADYGNCIGIPTVAGEVEFDGSFEKNCLVNVACVGVARREEIVLAEFKNPGDIIVLVGGSTGRDGIHGVTFASKTLSEESEADRPAVQIGDPFMKKLLIDAVLEALKTGYVSGLKDLGGGGLTCATSEMSAKGGVGVEIDLDKVHVREEEMNAYELMLSESQERMLFAVKPEGLKEVLQVFEKYEIPYSVLGRVVEGGRLKAWFKGEVVVDLPAELVARAPTIRRKARKPRELRVKLKAPKPPEPENLEEAFLKLLGSQNIASREWVYRQYDHEVGIRTVVKPGDGDAAVLRIMETGKAIAVTFDANSRHSALDPFHGHAGALAEAARNVACVGAEPLAYTDCCNFGNPEKPEVFWQFKRGIEGLAYMSRGLKIPCVGGNVSFYNEDEETRLAVKPTTTIVMVGLIERMEWVTTLGVKAEGDALVLVGRTFPELGGSEYYHEIHGLDGGEPPKASVRREKATLKTVMEAVRRGWVKAAHDCSKGGLAIALAKMAIKGGMGVKVDLERVPTSNVKRLDELLFSESHARIVLEVPANRVRNLLRLAAKHGASAARIGEVTGDSFTLQYKGKPVISCELPMLSEVWSKPIPEAMEGGGGG